MKECIVYKRYQGCAEIKHYELEEALTKKCPIQITLIENGRNVGIMTIPFEKLNTYKWHEEEKGLPIRKSKYDSLDYYLVAYTWKKDESKEQLKLF